MATSSDSAETGSDTYVPYICDPCKYLGSDKGATGYCGQCNEYLCKSCEQSHRGARATRNHDLITGKELSSTFTPIPTLPIAYCGDHRSNLIKSFCESHKTLTCDVCSTTLHRKCPRTALRDKSSKMSISQLDKMVARMKEIKQRIEKLRASREKATDMLIKQAKQSISDVKGLRKKINEQFDALEKNAYTAIDEAKTANESELRDHVTACENILKEVDKSIKEMQDCQASMNEEMMFIGLTKSSSKVDDIEKIATDMEVEATECKLTFHPNKVIDDFLQQVKELGHVITTSESSDVSGGEGILNMTVSSKQDIDIESGLISGSTFLPSGDLVLCDRDNNRLHLYSPTFTSKENVSLWSHPWDVCTVADTEVAVTFPDQQKIQFVSVQPRLRLRHLLRVERKCWGIDCHGGFMYVSCHNNPGYGEVLVMTMDGQIQRRLGLDDQVRYTFTSPDYVRVSHTSGRVYVSDCCTNIVTCLTQHGGVVNKYIHEDLSGPTDIHVDSQDNILVSGWRSNNIHCVDKHGTHHSILVSKSDGVVVPYCLSYRDTDGVLVVGMVRMPTCKVFWLNK